MKKILLLFFVCFYFVSPAQIVNIPDINFKNALLTHSPEIDTNHDGEIQVSEALVATQISVPNKNISDLTGIREFANIISLTCSGNFLTTIDVSGLAHLSYLTAASNLITSVNLNNCPVIFNIDFQSNQLTDINLTVCPTIRSVKVDTNALTSIDFAGLNELAFISCKQNNLTSLIINNLPKLATLHCKQNNLSTLEVNNCPLMNLIDCSENQLAAINISTLSSLAFLTCSQNQLTSFDLTNLTGLVQIICTDNLLTEINAGRCSNLYSLDCRRNPFLTWINIKNGVTVFSYLPISNNPSLQYICVDENEISSIQNIIAGVPGININSYCTTAPGGAYNTINGSIRADENNNGCDVADPLLNLVKVKISNGTQTSITQSMGTGNYFFYTNAGNFTLTPELPNAHYTINPSSAPVSFATTGNNFNTTDFCLVPNGNVQDLNIVLLPLSPARPGVPANYRIIYNNAGTTTLSGNVSLNFESTRLTFLFANPAVTTQGNGSLSWNYSNLLPLESRSIILQFGLMVPPANNSGDSLFFTTNINPVAGDANSTDNAFKINQRVTGSFDPNDKTCVEGKYIDITKVGDFVHYVIRFQNTGTDTAFNVVIKDLLSDQYDWNSLQLIAASHLCLLKQTAGNKLEFIFENILLPAQSVNDEGSNGYVAFRIKAATTVGLNDSLVNNASIYFDFNFPVVTENAITIFTNMLPVPVIMEYFNGKKEYSKNILTWKASCSAEAVFNVERSNNSREFVMIGGITSSNSRCLQPFEFADTEPVAGVNYYRIKMIDADGKATHSNIIALLNKKDGFEITGINPNPVTSKVSYLNIIAANQEQISITVMDLMGRPLYESLQTIPAGPSQVALNLVNLTKGVYFISLNTNNGERKVLRFIKQ